MGRDYDNTNRGALFKNDRREKDSHPEYNGTINIEGTEYWLNAWVKSGSKGKFFSLSVKPKQGGGGSSGGRGGAPARSTTGRAPPTRQSNDFGDDFADDDIPFLQSRSVW